MPVNDDPFASVEPEEEEASPIQPPDDSQKPSGDLKSGTKGASAVDTGQLIADAMKPVHESINNLNAQLAKQNQPAVELAPAPISDDEFGQQFYQSPRETVDQRVEAMTAPVVAQVAAQFAEVNLRDQQQRIDNEWGQGAFDEVIGVDLRPIIDEAKRMNPNGLLDRTAFVNAVDTIAGRKARQLFDYAHTTTVETENAKLQQAAKLRDSVLGEVEGNLIGGLRRGGSGAATLNDEAKEVVKGMFRADGVKRDEARLAALTSKPVRTLEDYKALNKSLKKEKK